MKIDAALPAVMAAPTGSANRDQQWRSALERAQWSGLKHPAAAAPLPQAAASRDSTRDSAAHPLPGSLPGSVAPFGGGVREARAAAGTFGPVSGLPRATLTAAADAGHAASSAGAYASSAPALAAEPAAGLPSAVQVGGQLRGEPCSAPNAAHLDSSASRSGDLEAWTRRLGWPPEVAVASVCDGRLSLTVRDSKSSAADARRLLARVRAQAAVWGLELGDITLNGLRLASEVPARGLA